MTAPLEVIETGEIVEAMTADEAWAVTAEIRVRLDAMADDYQSAEAKRVAVMPLIERALTRQAYAAIGYRSPQEYVATEFKGALGKLGIDTRRYVVQALTAAGLSTRAIAPIVEVSHKTVVKDQHAIAGGTEVPPDPDPTSFDPDLIPAEPDSTFVDFGPGPGTGTDLDTPYLDDEPALTEAECEALADPADVDEPKTAPRITGVDGKSYPASKPRKPNRKPITDAFWTAAYDLEKRVRTVVNLAGDDRFKSNADQIGEKNLVVLVRARDALQRVIDQLQTRGA